MVTHVVLYSPQPHERRHNHHHECAVPRHYRAATQERFGRQKKPLSGVVRGTTSACPPPHAGSRKYASASRAEVIQRCDWRWLPSLIIAGLPRDVRQSFALSSVF